MVWCRAGLRSENLSVYTDFFYEPQTFANRWNPHALYHVLATGLFFFFNPLSNIIHFINPQTYLDDLCLNQGGWCVGGFNFFSVGLLNPFKFHECFHAGGKKDKLFCNFWSAGGLCANRKWACHCVLAIGYFICFSILKLSALWIIPCGLLLNFGEIK